MHSLGKCKNDDRLHPISGNSRDYDPLMKMIGDARFVLWAKRLTARTNFIGERALITRNV
jgi:hypothetical protein